MNSRIPVISLMTLLVCKSSFGGDFLDFFKSKTTNSPVSTATASLSGLTEDQITSGLKEALANGVQEAVSNLGKTDGFLGNLSVKIPLPESMQKVEKTLRTLQQGKLADEFVATMNHAAEQAVPEAAAVLGDSVKQMSVSDAKTILTGPSDAATQYFRRTSETNLYARFLPIVKTATSKTGVTAAYKRMTDKAASALGSFGGFGSSLLDSQALNIDAYVTQKTLDGLFLKIAEQEKQIRENPAARTTDLLKNVFGAIGK